MASAPASHHAPALHYRARGSILLLMIEEISTLWVPPGSLFIVRSVGLIVVTKLSRLS